MEYEKVIFLDIDGPLATTDCFKNTEYKWGRNVYKWNPACVEILNDVLRETGAVIVLSSDWRKFFTTQDLIEIFEWNNVIQSPVAITDTHKHRLHSLGDVDRIFQIGRFLKENQIKKWVCVDDMNLTSDIVTNFVHVEEEFGISAEGIKDKLISFLN